MDPEVRHFLTVRRDATGRVKGTEAREKLARARQRSPRGRIQPLQRGRIASAPTGQLQCEWNEIGVDDFGR